MFHLTDTEQKLHIVTSDSPAVSTVMTYKEYASISFSLISQSRLAI